MLATPPFRPLVGLLTERGASVKEVDETEAATKVTRLRRLLKCGMAPWVSVARIVEAPNGRVVY